jgi:transposase-like protein
MTPDKIRVASELIGKESVAAIARLLGVNRATLYAHVPALQDRRRTALPRPGRSGTTSPASKA